MRPWEKLRSLLWPWPQVQKIPWLRYTQVTILFGWVRCATIVRFVPHFFLAVVKSSNALEPLGIHGYRFLKQLTALKQLHMALKKSETTGKLSLRVKPSPGGFHDVAGCILYQTIALLVISLTASDQRKQGFDVMTMVSQARADMAIIKLPFGDHDVALHKWTFVTLMVSEASVSQHGSDVVLMGSLARVSMPAISSSISRRVVGGQPHVQRSQRKPAWLECYAHGQPSQG
eukprot:g2830.t1